MKLHASVLNHWLAAWMAPASPYPMAAFRILLGLYMLVYLGALATRVPLLFSDQGVYSPFLISDPLPPLSLAWGLYGLTLLAALGVTLGVAYRLSVLGLLTGFGYHYLLSLASSASSYDRLILIFLTLMVLMPEPKVWRLGQADESTCPVSGWGQRLICLQTALFYFGAGWYKAFIPGWQNGQLLKWTLAGPWSTPLAAWLMPWGWPDWLFDGLTYAIILFEISCVWGLFHPTLKRWFLLAGVGFHLSIWLLMNIPQFLICLCPYVLFLSADTVKRTGQRLGLPAQAVKEPKVPAVPGG